MIFNQLKRTILSLHDGDPISDEDLNYSIELLNQIKDVFDQDFISMPEYKVFVKALRRDIDQLEDFQFSRNKGKKNVTSN